MRSPFRLADKLSLDPTSSFGSYVANCEGVARCAVLVFLVGFLTTDLQSERLHGNEPIARKKDFRIVLFTPRNQDDHFWGPFAEFMGEAAEDLGMQLEVQYAGSSRNLMASQIREACRHAEKPDGIAFQSFKRGGPNFLRIANRHKVTALLVNAGLQGEQAKSLGEPRTKLEYWLGELMPNDFDAGFQLANALIDEAQRDPQRVGEDGKVHVIGLIGVISDGASTERLAGLQDAVDRRSNEVTLDQVVAADWNQELARTRCRVLHRRYPSASVVWSASDPMAFGAIEAIRDRELRPGTDVIVGGVDATPEAMDLIELGTLYATVGGHVMDGGWVAVLLHDFFHGIDLERIPKHYASPMRLVTRENVDTYRVVFDRSTWKQADFRQFSLLDKPDQKHYRFDIRELVPKQDEALLESSGQSR